MQIDNQQDSEIERENKVIPPITAESSITAPDKDTPAIHQLLKMAMNG